MIATVHISIIFILVLSTLFKICLRDTNKSIKWCNVLWATLKHSCNSLINFLILTYSCIKKKKQLVNSSVPVNKPYWIFFFLHYTIFNLKKVVKKLIAVHIETITPFRKQNFKAPSQYSMKLSLLIYMIINTAYFF